MKIKIKLNVEGLKGHKKGEIIEINDENQNCEEFKYWQRRLKDAKYDKCCEIVPEKVEKAEKPEKKRK
jgi:hypothetical protein